ncbi:MAG: zinc-ribbon domain-containing protein [Nitrospina sp.]|nr:zinc-ribbon domain-containing protein [Nitrospina sp.]
MKFSCPECQAKYQVDLPATGEEGVEVKCARCQHTFRVHEETAGALSAGASSSATETGGTDSLMDSEPDVFDASPAPEENLDAFLDELIQQEKLEGTTPATEFPDVTTPDTNLDGLLENLLADTPDETGSGLADEELDQIWEESVEQGQQEDLTDEPLPETEIPEQDKQQEAAKTEPVVEEPSASPEEDAPEEDLWAQAFADQAATEAKQAQEEPAEAGGEDTSEEDLWAQAFADQEATEAKQTQEEPAETEGKNDNSEEDLWAQAFDETTEDATDEKTAPAAMEEGEEGAEPETTDEDVSDEEMQKLAAIAQDDSAGLGLADEALANYNEEDYADFEDDEEFETEAPAKKLGFIPLPSGKTGKLVVGGGVAALLLIAGSAYFAIQTFAPPELVEDAQVAESAPQPEPETGTQTAEEAPATSAEPAKDPDQEKAGEAASAVEEAQNALLGEEAAGEEKNAAESTGLQNALQPFADIVEMSSIMPVAYSPTDIKVLSFTIQLEMDQPRTAEGMRNSLPVYEKIVVSTVENFLKRKFYNDILYVKEKLVKKLELALNKGLKQGKIKKAKFKEFQIS